MHARARAIPVSSAGRRYGWSNSFVEERRPLGSGSPAVNTAGLGRRSGGCRDAHRHEHQHQTAHVLRPEPGPQPKRAQARASARATRPKTPTVMSLGCVCFSRISPWHGLRRSLVLLMVFSNPNMVSHCLEDDFATFSIHHGTFLLATAGHKDYSDTVEKTIFNPNRCCYATTSTLCGRLSAALWWLRPCGRCSCW